MVEMARFFIQITHTENTKVDQPSINHPRIRFSAFYPPQNRCIGKSLETLMQ